MSRNQRNKGNNVKEESNGMDSRDSRDSRDYKGKKPLKKGYRLNDPNWYFQSAELAEQASQLSFQNVLGSGNISGYEIPTIMRVDLNMCPGNTYDISNTNSGDFTTPLDSTPAQWSLISDTSRAGINVMTSKLYTLMSTFTGRTSTYAPQDVGIMLLVIAAISEFSEMIRRCFGLVLTYNYWNRTLALGLLRSMGLDVNDFIANISVYRMRFNVLMSRINQIPLLENIGFIKKCRDIYQYVYQDDPTNMSQLFYYMPKYAYVLDEAGDEEGSILRATAYRFDNVATKMSVWLDILENMIDGALNSSTLNFIYADILNMSNKLKVSTWQFDYLAENYVVTPVYNQNALLQFHNLTIVGEPYNHTGEAGKYPYLGTAGEQFDEDIKWTSGSSIYCDVETNSIVYNPVFMQGKNRWALRNGAIVDMPTDKPSMEDKIEALRFSAAGSGVAMSYDAIEEAAGDTNYFQCFVKLPDHYAVEAQVFRNVDQNGWERTPYTFAGSVSYNTGSYPVMLTQFEHAPLFCNTGVESGSNRVTMNTLIGQLQFYTTVSADYIQRLLNITYVGLFDFRV